MNEKLKFRLPTAEDAAEYISYRQAFLDAGSSMDGTGPMRRTPDPMEWLAINAQYADPATVPEGKVQSINSTACVPVSTMEATSFSAG